MAEFVPVLVAIVTTLGTVAAAYFAARSGRFGRAGDQTAEVAGLRSRCEVEEAKNSLLTEQLVIERAQHELTRKAEAEAVARAEYAERDSDACERRLNMLYAELRKTGRLEDRRTEHRDAQVGT